MRTLNGEVLIDDDGNLNEQVWLESLIECYKLLYGEKQEHEY